VIDEISSIIYLQLERLGSRDESIATQQEAEDFIITAELLRRLLHEDAPDIGYVLQTIIQLYISFAAHFYCFFRRSKSGESLDELANAMSKIGFIRILGERIVT
jgi:transcriptional antiterminator